MNFTGVTARSAYFENSVSSGAFWRAKLPPLSEKNRQKNRQIGGADQKKHMVVEFFNTSWRILMGNTVGKAYHIVWYFQNWAKFPPLTKKNRQEKSSNWRWRRWRQTLSAKDKCDHQIQIDWLTNLVSLDQLFEEKCLLTKSKLD